MLWPNKIFRKISKTTGEERIEADLELQIVKLIPINQPLKVQSPIVNCRAIYRSASNFVPKYDTDLLIENSSQYFVDFEKDQCLIYELDYVTGK